MNAFFGAMVWFAAASGVGDGNRLVHLDTPFDPFSAGRIEARLATPQWVGDEGVDAVVLLSIDDMRATEPYETFLGPILDRLQQIDGRAPVTIFTCVLDPNWPQLAQWREAGVDLGVHTIAHPCPLLQRGDFAAAARTVHECTDMIASVVGSGPLAYRMPCCDSMSSLSPRFFAEIFEKTTPAGHALSMDSSVFWLPTPARTDLPRAQVHDPSGHDRFRPYLPLDHGLACWIEDHPHPYVIGRTCWEVPCAVPSDWQAQHRHGIQNPITVADWKAALDLAVCQQGCFSLVFHPYDWSRPAQIVELIDYAVAAHGSRVRFLAFREVGRRLEDAVLGGRSLRAADGTDAGARLLDLDADGFLDAVVAGDEPLLTRRWSPQERRWIESSFPVPIVVRSSAGSYDGGVRFCVLRPDGRASLLVRTPEQEGLWHFTEDGWQRDPLGVEGLGSAEDRDAVWTARNGRDLGVRLRDLDDDGVCELLESRPGTQRAFRFTGSGWALLPFALPEEVRVVDERGRDAGLRFADVDLDGKDDLLFSNAERSSVHRFLSMSEGFRTLVAGPRGEGPDLAEVVFADGSDGGVFCDELQVFAQNEHTGGVLPHHIDRRPFRDLQGEADPPPRSAGESARAFRVAPGFRVELVAAEPLVQDPVDFAWGADGKLWVVEMADYPLGLDDAGEPGGRVRILEDRDGDGTYEHSTLFLDRIPFPTSVMPWRDGTLVCAAPEIFFAADRDGDGRAEVREILYAGFGEGNQQHRVNSLRFDLDGWLSVANGDSGGEVRSTKTGRSVELRGHDLRIDPRTGALELQSGTSQFGRVRDDFGQWFGCNNSEPAWHFALELGDLVRNPHVAAPEGRVDVRASSGVFPIGRVFSHWEGYQPPPPGEPGEFTSACGIEVYRDDRFGAAFRGNLFVSEPIHSVVHRIVLESEGASFRGRRAPGDERREFLASADPWFRPTTLRTGPDGGLWIADMVRLVLEHPEWIDDEEERRLDLRAGHELGRIWRVVPVDDVGRAVPVLARRSDLELVAALDTSNGWQRDMAHQLLLERHRSTPADLPFDPAVVAVDPAIARLVGPLESSAQNGSRPETRVQALAVLADLGALSDALLRACLDDAHSGVRRQAVRIAARRLGSPACATLLGPRVAALLDDTDGKVVLAAASALGEWHDPAAARALARLADRDPLDPLLGAAALGSIVPHLPTLLVELIARTGASGSPDRLGVTQYVAGCFATAASAGDPSLLATLFTELAARCTAADRSPASTFELAAILLAHVDLERAGALHGVDAAMRTLHVAAERVTCDSTEDAGVRTVAATLLGRTLVLLLHDGWSGSGTEDGAASENGVKAAEPALERAFALLDASTPPSVQHAFLDAVAPLAHPLVPALALQGWRGHSPDCRDAVVRLLLQRPQWSLELLDHLTNRPGDAATFDISYRDALLTHGSPQVRVRAETLFSGQRRTVSSEQVESLLAAWPLQGDVAEPSGAERDRPATFVVHCAACHRVDGVGVEFGPDLRALVDRSPRAILTAILDPSAAFESKYAAYQAFTKDGRSFTGSIAAESATSIDLVDANGEVHTLRRLDLEELRATDRSPMPANFAELLAPDELVAVVAYLQSVGVPAKQFEGNHPVPVAADAAGALHLRVTQAEIYGPSLRLDRAAVVGYWSSPQDRLAWTAVVERAGRYEVSFEFACPDSTAGNAFVLEVGDQRLVGRVPATGSWENYRVETFGMIELTAGVHRVSLRSAGPISAYLMDLERVTLAPLD